MNDTKGGPMEDLDFDELHEAVNKLMNQTQKPKSQRQRASAKTPAPTPSTNSLSQRPPLKVVDRPAASDAPVAPKEEPAKELPPPAAPDKKPAQTASQNGTVAVRRITPTPTVKPKRRGMAMDVIQAPKQSAIAPPSVRPARVGRDLRPTRPVVPQPPSPRASSVIAPPPHQPHEPTDVSEDTLKSLNMQSDSVAHPQGSLESQARPGESMFPDPINAEPRPAGAARHMAAPREPAKNTDMPDPLAGADAVPPPPLAHGERTITPPPTTPDEAPLFKDDELPRNVWEMPEEPDDAKTASSAAHTPDAEKPQAPSMASVAGDATPFVSANVQKRPLGAYASAPRPSATQPLPDDRHEPSTEPLPQSQALNATAEPASPAPQPEPAPAATIATPEELSPEVVAVESAEPEYTPQGPGHEAAPLQNLRQMSIPQQYHAPEREPTNDDRPVFDTKDYHTPLQPVMAPKHTGGGSKAGIILTIILIILLVVAAAVAYFVATGAINVGTLFGGV